MDEVTWLNEILVKASDLAHHSVRIKASGEQYASASMRVALDLNNALKNLTKRKSFDNALRDTIEHPESAVISFVKAVPFILEPTRFSAPNGMFDLPHILASAYFVPRSSDGLDVAQYQKLLRIFNLLLLRVQLRFIDNSLSNDRDAFVEKLKDIDTWKIPDDVWKGYKINILPSPAAVMAVLGSNPLCAPADINNNFCKFVGAIHNKILEMFISTPVTPNGGNQIENGPTFEPTDRKTSSKDVELFNVFQLKEGSPLTLHYAQYIWHMRAFLFNAAERLSLSLLTCDRVPIVAPWYAATILAARAYATWRCVQI